MSGSVVLDLLRRPPLSFLDRDSERQDLFATVGSAFVAGRPSVVVLTGMPGVGKTALAVRMVDELRAGRSFEVVLLISVGEAAHARSVEDVLSICLNALGMRKIPANYEARTAAFRAATARPTLLLLDDVDNAEQIQALLPGSATAVVIATSRRRTDGFEYYRHRVLPVEPFDPGFARMLLADGLRPESVSANDSALDELARLCGYLPYALDIARARLRIHYRGDVSAYIRAVKTAESALAAFTIEGQPRLVHLFEEAYQRLPESARGLYPLLGLHAGLQFSERVAIALAGPDHPGDVVAGLRVLVDWCLLAELPGGRYEMHTLTAQHSRSLLADVHPADIDGAQRRMVRAYLEFVVSRELVLSDRVRLGPLFRDAVEPAYLGEGAYARAEADMQLERANLRRIVAVANEIHLDDSTWQLCEALITFYFQRDLYDDAIEVHGEGLDAARRLALPGPLLVMHNALGRAYFGKRMHQQALDHFRQAGAQAGLLHDSTSLFVLAQAAIWEAFVHQRLDDHAAAVRALSESRLLVEDPGFPEQWRDRELRLLDMNGSLMLASVGRFEEAIAAARRAVAYFSGGKEEHNHAKSVANLGRVLADCGVSHTAEALEQLTLAVELEAAGGLTSWEADSCEVLGELLIRLGRDDEGRDRLARAAELNARLEVGGQAPD